MHKILLDESLFEHIDNLVELGNDKAQIQYNDITMAKAELDSNKVEELTDEVMKDKNKEVEDFINSQEKKEPDHTIKAERARLNLEESLFEEITQMDFYKDTHGIMGEANLIYSEQELRDYYNDNKDYDPSVYSYSSEDAWFNDTIKWMELIEEENLSEAYGQMLHSVKDVYNVARDYLTKKAQWIVDNAEEDLHDYVPDYNIDWCRTDRNANTIKGSAIDEFVDLQLKVLFGNAKLKDKLPLYDRSKKVREDLTDAIAGNLIAGQDDALAYNKLSEEAEDSSISNDEARQAIDERKDEARRIINDKNKLLDLLKRAEAKKNSAKVNKLSSSIATLTVLINMVKDTIEGKYDLKFTTLVTIVAAIIYVVSPADAIPDAVPGVGYVDDAAVLGLVLKTFDSEIDRYKKQITESLDEVDHMIDVTNFDNNFIKDLEDNKKCLCSEVDGVKNDYKKYFTEQYKPDLASEIYNAIADVCFNHRDDASQSDIEDAVEWFLAHYFESDDFKENFNDELKSELLEFVTDFDYTKYGYDEEEIKDIIDDMIQNGIDPWDSSYREETKAFLVDDLLFDEYEAKDIIKCIRKYVSENEYTSTVWDAVYNELVSKSTGEAIFGDTLDSKPYKYDYDDIVIDADGITVKSVIEDRLDYAKNIAKLYHLEIGKVEYAKGKFFLKIKIPESIQLMDVKQYLSQFNQE